MSVSRSALELTEVRCFCPAGTQGHAVLQLRSPLRLTESQRKTWHEFSYGRASPIHIWVSETKSMMPLKPTRAASHRDAPRTTGRSALQRRCDLEAAAKGQQTKGKDGGRRSAGLASGAAGVSMIRPTTSPAGRAAVLQLRATSGRLHRSLQCPFVAERRW